MPWVGRLVSLLSLAACVGSAPAGAQSLAEALTATYQSNPSLLAARAELKAVNEGVPQALSDWRPSVSLAGAAGAQRIDAQRPGGAETTYPIGASVLLAQPLYRGGRTIAAVSQAEAEVRAQRARLASSEQTVLLDAAVAYMDVWRDQAVLRLNESNEAVLAQQLEATRDRFDVGELTRTDVAQAESRLARARANRIAAEGDLAVSRAVFAEVVGFAPGVLAAPPALDGLPAGEEEAVAAALDENPDLITAIQSEIAARHQVRASVGELLPVVSLSVQLSHTENQLAQSTETDEAQVLALITIPLYQQGFVTSRVREDKQTARQRRIQVDETRRRVLQETIDAWEGLVEARASTIAFETEVQAGVVVLEGVRQEHEVGARTTLDILDAEQELLDAQVNLARGRRDTLVAGFQVLVAEGRLSAANLALPVEVYDPEADYRAVRDRWFGLAIPGE